MLAAYGLKTDDIEKFEASNRCLFVGKTIEGDTYTMDFLSEHAKPKGIHNFIDWLNAHAEARNQYECYRDMVSGRWSIDANEFCDQYELDYKRADEQAFEAMSDDYEDYFAQEQAKLEKRIGDLSDEQRENLDDACREEYGYGDNEEYFWHYLLRQLEEAPEFEKYHDEYVRENYKEHYV